MSDVSIWRLFAFMDGDEDGELDETRSVADWQVEDVLRWARYRGYDHIYLCRDPAQTVRFERAEPTAVRHHPIRLVGGSDGEQGDSAA